MRKIILAIVPAMAILVGGSLMSKPAEAFVGAPLGASIAAETVAPVENVAWCGWRCRGVHHRSVFFHRRAHFFHRRPIFAYRYPHHRRFFVHRHFRRW